VSSQLVVGSRYLESLPVQREVASVSSQESDGGSDSLLKLGAHIEETSSLTTDNWHWQLLLSDEVLIPTQLIARLDQLVDFLI
jgi:hypothetical protein